MLLYRSYDQLCHLALTSIYVSRRTVGQLSASGLRIEEHDEEKERMRGTEKERKRIKEKKERKKERKRKKEKNEKKIKSKDEKER